MLGGCSEPPCSPCINPTRVLDVGVAKFINWIQASLLELRILVRMPCPWLSVGWMQCGTHCCSQHGVDGSAGNVCPELGNIEMLEVEALGAVGFLLDCFPDGYYKN